MDKIELISKVSEDNYTNYLTDKYDLQVTSEHKTIIPMIDENELNSYYNDIVCDIKKE